LNAKTDSKIWNYVLKTSDADIDYQWANAEKILKRIEKIEGESKSTKEGLLSELNHIYDTL
jgi:hypothetical protein